MKSDEKDDDKIRLGGMALPNGVLVHGPASWACAIRGEDGKVEVAAEYKRFRAANVSMPFLRGPARLAEALAVLPQIRRALPGGLAPARVRNHARAVAELGALAASTEIFGWMTRNPDHLVARTLSRPGHELQHRLSTAEPSAAQLEVAEAALAACLELEHGA